MIVVPALHASRLARGCDFGIGVCRIGIEAQYLSGQILIEDGTHGCLDTEPGFPRGNPKDRRHGRREERQPGIFTHTIESKDCPPRDGTA